MASLSAAYQDFMVADRAARVPSEVNGFRIASDYSPAFEVGGDFYAIAPAGPHSVNVVIGDVCGRGAGAAELVHLIRPEVQRLVRSSLGPSRILDALNELACRCLPEGTFVTAACLRLDAAERRMTVANAGHVPPLLRRVGGVVSLVGIPSGPPLGMLTTPEYFDEWCHVTRGDVVLLMTDGVLEAVEEDLITMRHLLSLLSAAPNDPRAINERIIDEINRTSHRPDDMTLLSLKVGDDAATGIRRDTPSSARRLTPLGRGAERRLSGVS
jgi:serine phosphatase RsbU (regulator of sigma subunit)